MNEYRNLVVETIKAAGQELIDRADTFISPDIKLLGDVHITVDIVQGEYPYVSITMDTPVSNIKSVYEKFKI